MKNLIILVICFFAAKAYSQTNEVVFQEKSSDWIKVTLSPQPKSPTVVKRKTSSKKPPVPKQDAQQEFDMTNSHVNRFKKAKKS